MSISLEFIRAEITAQTYELSVHADDERVADPLLLTEVEYVLLHCQQLEDYPDDPRGESCLVVGFTPEGIPVSRTCGLRKESSGTSTSYYIPTMPKWRDPCIRNR
jgi:hypothetical protein